MGGLSDKGSNFRLKFKSKQAFLVWLVMISYGKLIGQTIPDSIISIKEIMISASRMPEHVNKINMSGQLISKADLNYIPYRNLPEALMHQGLWIQKTNHGGGSPFIRGFTGNQVLVIKDGIRMNNSIYRYGPNQYLSLQPAFGLEQVEIIKGSGSVQYGSDAIGGLIHLISRKPNFAAERAWSGDISSQWASAGVEKTIHATIGLSKKNFALLASSAFSDYGDLQGGKNANKLSPSGYNEYQSMLISRLQNKSGLWELSYSLSKQNDIPVYHKIVLEGFNQNQSDVLAHQIAYLKNKFDFSGSSFLQNLETTVSWQNLYEQRSLKKKSTDPLRIEKDRVQVFGFSTSLNVELSKSTRTILGMDLYLDKVNSSAKLENNSTVSRGLYPNGAEYFNAALFNDWKTKINKWDFSYGWRWNMYRLKSKDANLGEVILKPSAFVWHIGLGKSFGNHRLFINADKTFRAPNVDDAGTLGIVDFRYEVPNFNLKPESGMHFSLGHQWTDKAMSFYHSIYYMQLQDLITRVARKGDSIQGYPVYIKQNADKSYVYGLESTGNIQLTNQVCFNTNLQYTFGQNRSAHEPIRRIPPLYYTILIKYQVSFKWGFYLESVNAGNQKRLSAGDLADNRIAKTGTPAWNIINTGLNYRFSILNIKAGLENIFNQDYRIHGSGINGAGRVARLSLQIKW